MENGVYQVLFTSNDNSEEGIVVIDGNSINGGGPVYICQGRVTVGDKILSGSFAIKKWNDQAPATLGLFKEVSFPVKGGWDPEKKSFCFEGQVNGHHAIKIRATGRYVAPLV